MLEKQAIIADTLKSFSIDVKSDKVTRGSSITRYEFAVPYGQSMRAITRRKNDIMAATQNCLVNILAPIPGKATVGIELENSVKEPVYLRELLQSEAFHNPKIRIPIALGKDVYGEPVIGDLAAMPHVLVAGSMVSGKSVCIDNILLSLLYKFRPDELKLVLVDSGLKNMYLYKKLPHLAMPVVVSHDRAINALRWAVNEVERRYELFCKRNVRNIVDFNSRLSDAQPPQDEPAEDEKVDMRTADAIVRDIEDYLGYDIPGEDEEEQLGLLDLEANDPDKLPYIVLVINELADLIAQVIEDLELYICRLAAKARAAGIHMIVATQTPHRQVITGIIKANLPCRIALKVASGTDSRVILDEKGAEKLMGNGDLLFLPPGGPTKMERAQGAFVTDTEIQQVVNHCCSYATQSFEKTAAGIYKGGDSLSDGRSESSQRLVAACDGDEELYARCEQLVIAERKASTTLLQRRFSIGYGKAARIMEMLEMRGVVAPATDSRRPREVLINAPE